MITLQQQFEKDFPNKNIEDILNGGEKYEKTKFTNYDLDLREYKKLWRIFLTGNKITSINLSGCRELKWLELNRNNLTSVDFLNTLPNIRNLERLYIHSNDIQPTDISIFSKFTNIKVLKIGTTEYHLKQGKRNKFYGSLKSWQNLTKLEYSCIEATDVDSGLEYLPLNLVKLNKKELGYRYKHLECSPHNTNAKVKVIQDELRPFDYDIEAWQLAHSKPIECFVSLDAKEQQIRDLIDMINKTEQDLKRVRISESDKLKKIERLGSKLTELQKAKKTLEKSTQTKLTMIDKETQTELTQEVVMELMKQLETKK